MYFDFLLFGRIFTRKYYIVFLSVFFHDLKNQVFVKCIDKIKKIWILISQLQEAKGNKLQNSNWAVDENQDDNHQGIGNEKLVVDQNDLIFNDRNMDSAFKL